MASRRSIFPIVIAAFAAVTTPPARAAVPYPPACTVDACLRVCPAGDMNLHVVVRDVLSNPEPFANVVVDFSPCPGVVLCPTNGSEPYTIAPPSFVTMAANAAGVADIPIRAGGVCSGATVNIYADGVLIAQRPAVSSPDQNGDATVNATDQGILAAKLGGSYDPTADLNCGGTLGAGDAGILDAHLGHSCGAVVPVVPKSWGTIKLIYR